MRDAIRMKRRFHMSAMAPAQIEKNRIGSDDAACTSAIMSAEGASRVIAQAAPTDWNQVPKLAMRFAIQIARKKRWRRGASAPARAGRSLPATESLAAAASRGAMDRRLDHAPRRE